MKALYNINTLIVLGIVGLLLYIWFRGAGKAAADISEGAVSVAGGIVSGTTIGLGKNFGIPETNTLRCKAAQQSGDYWNQSLYCTASEFIGGLFKSGGNTTHGDVPGAFVVEKSIFTG
jgi:hypothetical protein